MTISKALLAALTLALAIVSYWLLPHADFADYGKFADDPTSSRNVFSNVGFLIAGAAGVYWSMRHQRELEDDFAAALTLFSGVIATGLGSAYFHLHPLAGTQLNRSTLLWDRLPMTVAFAGLLALVMRDRVSPRANRIALPVLTVVGIGTVLFWYWSHDLYPYAFFQLYAAVGTLLMITMLRSSYNEAGYVASGVILFGIAKVFEDFDHEIFGEWGIGGHPLKHITAAIAALMILLWLKKRVKA